MKIDRLDHCIQTEAGRGLVFRMQTHFYSAQELRYTRIRNLKKWEKKWEKRDEGSGAV